MIRKILISRRDFLQDSAVVLSNGFWNPGSPLNNILDSKPSLVAEALTNLDWNATKFDVDLGYQRNNVGLFFFANLFTSSLGFMRLRASLNADLSFPGYDSGVVSTWPRDNVLGENSVWGDFSLNGVYSGEEYANLGMTRFFVPDAPIMARYIRVEVMDSTAEFPLRIGCFGACEVWESPDDFAPGPSVTVIDESDIQRVPFGTSYVTRRGIRRRLNLGFPALERNEVLTKTLGLALMKGKSQPLCVVCFPDEEESLEKTSIYGLVSSDNVISNPFFGYYAQPIQIDQLI